MTRWCWLLLFGCASPAPRPAPRPVAAPPADAIAPDSAASPVCHDESISGGSSASNDVEGSLDKELIRRTIHSVDASLRACFEAHATPGVVNAQFTIARDGHISQALATGPDDALARCVCEVVTTLHFPAPRSPVMISYPFAFAAPS